MFFCLWVFSYFGQRWGVFELLKSLSVKNTEVLLQLAGPHQASVYTPHHGSENTCFTCCED